MLADHVTGNDVWIIPKHLYDKEGLMDNFTINDFAVNDDSKVNDQKNIDFGREFNSEKYQREVIHGSGPYVVDGWETGQRLKFSKKDNWWAPMFQKTICILMFLKTTWFMKR